ncbi:MAG: GNAT family N-acetyltransferase [Gemmatimonadales bacterium]
MIPRALRKYVSDLEAFPQDAVRAWRSAGAAGVWLETRRRTFDRAGGYSRYLVVEADLSTTRDIPVPDGVEIRPFTGDDWTLLGDMAGHRLTKCFAAAAGSGRVCLVAWRGSTAVGHIWFSPAIEQRYENFALPLPSEAIYLWQIQVSRSERRKGVGAALGSCGLRAARQQGNRLAWMITRSDNLAAQRSLASVASSRVVGTLTRIKVRSWMHTRFLLLPVPQPLPAASTQ